MQVHLTELRPGRAAVSTGNHCTSEAECRTQVYHHPEGMEVHAVVSASLDMYCSGELFLASPGEHLGTCLGRNLEPFL